MFGMKWVLIGLADISPHHTHMHTHHGRYTDVLFTSLFYVVFIASQDQIGLPLKMPYLQYLAHLY